MMNLIANLELRLYADAAPRLLVIVIVAMLSALYPTVATLAQPHQGFGADTVGGQGQPIYYVTNLNDSGPGSLRHAVSSGNRTVMFDVGGEIMLSSEIDVNGAFITIDGFSAPSPISLVNDGLVIDGDNGAHDIIVRGLRVRNALGDSITIRDGAHNVILDHISSQGATDGGIDITNGAFNITVQWSIIAENAQDHNHLTLVEHQTRRVSFHHNIFLKGQSRNPHSGWDPTSATTPPEIVSDIRNNLIWEFSAYGTVITHHTKSNVVNNFYYSSLATSGRRALYVTKGSQVYAEGNYSLNGVNVDSQGNQPAPFLAISVDTTDACTAAHEVLSNAGVKPRDAVDQQYLSAISLPACIESNPNLEVLPSRLDFSATIGGPNPSPKTLTITDSSGGGLSWKASSGATWLSFSSAGGTTPSTLSIGANSSQLAVGTYMSTIAIVAPNAIGSPAEIPVTFTVSPAVSTPKITTPNPGSVVPGPNVTFSWTTNGADVRNWRLYVGSTLGAKDLHDSGILSRTKISRDVKRLPTDGRAIWVQLRFDIAGTWQFADFQYTAASR